MSLTPEQRRADRAIIEAATPGRWTVRDLATSFEVIRAGMSVDGVLARWGCVLQSREDAAFIARAREGWPAAVDALDAAEEQVTEMIAANAALAAEIARLRALLARVPHLLDRLHPACDRTPRPPQALIVEGHADSDRAECARLGGACTMEER